jgi:hypothetical protein
VVPREKIQSFNSTCPASRLKEIIQQTYEPATLHSPSSSGSVIGRSGWPSTVITWLPLECRKRIIPQLS